MKVGINMKNTKKIITMILVMALIFSSITAITVSAALIGDENGFYFSVNVDTKTAVLEEYDGRNSDVVIPEYVYGYTVVSIKKNAFLGMGSIKTVKIPDTVLTIGKFAFQNCTSLKEVTLSSSVSNIQVGTFSGCTSLEKIIIPKSVTSISTGAFTNCDIDIFTIYGYTGSYAESFAYENGYKFVPLDAESSDTDTNTNNNETDTAEYNSDSDSDTETSATPDTSDSDSNA